MFWIGQRHGIQLRAGMTLFGNGLRSTSPFATNSAGRIVNRVFKNRASQGILPQAACGWSDAELKLPLRYADVGNVYDVELVMIGLAELLEAEEEK